MKINNEKQTIPVFLCVDDAYASFAAVTVKSLLANSGSNSFYKIYFLINKLSRKNRDMILSLKNENSDIEFVDISNLFTENAHLFHTRDYYSNTTYFRFFIPEIFPQYEKGIYLDSDVIVLDDISKLYNINLSTEILAAVPDEVVTDIPVFSEYSQRYLGIDKSQYFNAGILLMNFKEMANMNFRKELTELMEKFKFEVAQDQDYLNVLCYGRVKYLEKSWNKTPFKDCDTSIIPKIVHFKINLKPWHYSGIPYEEFFWEYARITPYYEMLLKMRENYTYEQKLKDVQQYKNLEELANREIEKAKNADYIRPVVLR